MLPFRGLALHRIDTKSSRGAELVFVDFYGNLSSQEDTTAILHSQDHEMLVYALFFSILDICPL
jgi:hypothetical protein